jgi:heme oxygenase
MQKNNDGSIIITKEDLEELNNAYQGLYDTLNRFPTSMQDFFEDEEYLKICKWQCLLNNEEFNASDWIDGYEEDDDSKEDNEDDG